MSKVKLARGLVGGWLIGRYYREMKENYQKGDWLEAGKDTAYFAITIGPVVAPNLAWRAAAPVILGVGAGLIVTVAIVEATGIGTTEDVIDMVLDPPSPSEFLDVVGPQVQEHITEPIIDYLFEEIWQKQLVDPLTQIWRTTQPHSLW